jgi:CHAT domain-containing protein
MTKEIHKVERPPDRHLTEDELEAIVFSVGPQGGRVTGSSGDATGVYAHVQACDRCRAVLENFQSAEAKFRLQKSATITPASEVCPSGGEWLRIVAGLVPEHEASEQMQHAVQCDHCGPLLRMATEDLVDETTPTELAALERLPSSQRRAQRRLAKRLARESRGDVGDHSPNHRMTTVHWLLHNRIKSGSLAAVAVIAVLGSMFLIRRPPPDAQREANLLVAEAYAQRRTIELRIPGEPFSPLVKTSTRGQGGSDFSSIPLWEAKIRIARALNQTPEDAAWQQIDARAKVLEGDKSGTAVKTLERLLEKSPQDNSIRLDLALAYSRTGDKDNEPLNYGRSIDLLGQVLAQEPNNTVALFNRAVLLKRLGMYAPAERDLKRYIELDPSTDWSKEAQSLLTDVQKHVPPTKNGMAKLLLKPLDLAQALKGRDTEQLGPLDAAVERYLDAAMKSWLLEAFPGRTPGTVDRTQYRSGLQALSQILIERHGDHWLADFLKALERDPEASLSVALMSESYNANATGHYERGRILAERAAARSKRTRNPAGLAQARWQVLFASRLSLNGRHCLSLSEHLWNLLEGTRYQWLKTRTLLDYGQCANLDRRIQLAVRLNDHASSLSKESNFPNLGLRATKFSADFALEVKDPAESFARAVSGLRTFWNGDFEYMPGYNLYTCMDDVAEDLGLWRLDVQTIEEALDLLGTDPDLGMRAVEQQRLANALVMSGDLVAAQRNYLLARNLFLTLSPGEATRNRLAEVEVGIAKVDLLQNKPIDAASRLHAIETQVAEAGDNYLSFDYYATYGQALRINGDLAHSGDSLRRAIEIAEHGIRSLKTESARLQWSRHCANAYREMVRLKLAENSPAALVWWESFKSASLPVATQHAHNSVLKSQYNSASAEKMALPDLRWLGPETAIITYLVFADRLSVWVYDGKTSVHRWVPITNEEIQRETRRFIADCADPTSSLSSLRLQGRTLYRLLIAPVADLLVTRKSLIIESDGPLESLPFGALIDSSDGYLIDRFTISFSPGINYLSAASSAYRFDNQSRALVIADSDSHPDLGLRGLPGAESEGRAVASLFERARFLENKGADLSDVIRELSYAELFHFAGHAVARDHLTGLVLSGEQKDNSVVLSATKIPTTAIRRLRLLVLSACDTAHGPSGSFSDSESLARTFVALGVPQVIASRWEVDSVSTGILMTDFYTRLKIQGSAAESLRSAQKKLRDEEALVHPYYWAAFSIFGKI